MFQEIEVRVIYLSKEVELEATQGWRGYVIGTEDRVRFKQVEKEEKGIQVRENYVQKSEGDGVQSMQKGKDTT